jgi:hypothetical protein
MVKINTINKTLEIPLGGVIYSYKSNCIPDILEVSSRQLSKLDTYLLFKLLSSESKKEKLHSLAGLTDVANLVYSEDLFLNHSLNEGPTEANNIAAWFELLCASH